MKNLLKKIDQWLDLQTSLLILLFVLLIFRLPNLVEPYWYGDEAIYLTVGNALKQGARLYVDIVDHKTPIIYYLAMVPSQLHFRLLLMVWSMISTIFFFHFAKQLFGQKTIVLFSTIVFVVLTSIPWFEGNIPNGELFVIGFILAGVYLIQKATLFETFLLKKQNFKQYSLREKLFFFFAGSMFGLAVLTKVPAILDVAAFFAIGWFMLITQLTTQKKQKKSLSINIKSIIISFVHSFGFIGTGLISTIVLSMIYFILRGSGSEYLQYGLLYNFRYADSWQLSFQNQWLLFLFTLQGKVFLLGVVGLILTAGIRIFHPRFLFISLWFCLSLFAATLSNRPYPHYFLQIIPPLSLLLGYISYQLFYLFPKKKENFFEIGGSVLLITVFLSILGLLQVKPYPTARYYQNFFHLLTGSISNQEYREKFDVLMKDNYQAAKIIKNSGVKKIFIWGTNPTLYALSETIPTGRFIVSFHIKDFAAYQETYNSVETSNPEFIVVMNNETTDLPQLKSYLITHYSLNQNYHYFQLWKRLP